MATETARKWTPGPWRAVKTNQFVDIVDSRDRDIIVTLYGGGVEAESKQANATLIAASPCMYEALVDAQHALAFLLGDMENSDPFLPKVRLNIRNAAAALAKANGERVS